MAEVGLKPTRKWIATQITALAAILVMWQSTGSWDVEETVALIGFLSQASIGWLVPNNPPETPSNP